MRVEADNIFGNIVYVRCNIEVGVSIFYCFLQYYIFFYNFFRSPIEGL